MKSGWSFFVTNQITVVLIVTSHQVQAANSIAMLQSAQKEKWEPHTRCESSHLL